MLIFISASPGPKVKDQTVLAEQLNIGVGRYNICYERYAAVSKLPRRFVEFQKCFPDLFSAYEDLGKAAAAVGPLDTRRASAP